MIEPRRLICMLFSTIAVVLTMDDAASGKVLLHASFDRAANADYAVGERTAQTATPAYTVATTTEAGRWGRALAILERNAHCVFDGSGNFDATRGTAELWFRVEATEGKYRPLFGWYRPPHEPGARKRLSAMEVYLHNSTLVLGLYTPKYKGHSAAVTFEVGKWHHLEINWDCERGDGDSVYNIFLDGKSKIRIIDGGALEAGEGGKVHLGVWDYALGNILRGQIDELRITDQVENSDDFQPPARPHALPISIEYAKQTHRVAIHRLAELENDLRTLRAHGSPADRARPTSGFDAKIAAVRQSLTATERTLKTEGPDVPSLCDAVDAAADQLSRLRLPISRAKVAAAALAAEEDKRSLLFKELNDTLAGEALVISGRQLFIDNRVIESLDDAHRAVSKRLSPVSLAQANAWDKWRLDRGVLMFDQRDSLLKTWYIGQPAGRTDHVLCLAESTDGRTWRPQSAQLPVRVETRKGVYERLTDSIKQQVSPGVGRCVAAPQLDRFVSVTATAGQLTTKPFIAIGDTLVVNADASRGEIRIEAIDALGRVVRRFSRDDCQPLTSDNVAHLVRWREDSNCHPLQARAIQLRFYIKNADLYSFEFQIRHRHFVPMSYRQ